ncbi:PRD domain-containing protein [Lactiplantibacillus paraplantarum]|uniref:PRD domain-containing protein n=1 Tax=Lactiplantibacillus paraplantarum TaxID=60520 RepID=A0A2I9D0C3_9LACO|nr:PRD domain-containing protein [Lactiplantibacillus paraplantarum]AVW11321.1 PRD domain-containing protein [Lactiplantibacillus paraplantarum]AYJ39734.1 PRD domain-containing protein [Lactiplantibacillus paraplantarum]ERL45737.1 transcription antiterminator [Lactiplantibacillus paraplantarum]KRL50778.1 transcription antiterminator [Lactiplantibacillus paraplantarum DSM 10667]MCU4684814.1 PRD domain-containing protein [Lactiplantibacillus paraplantarum]
MLRIKKVLNSSVVLVTDEHNQEFILLGKGIGYGKRPGAVIMKGDFNQVFVASSDPNVEQLLATIASSSPQLIEITQTIVSEATEQLRSKLSDTLYVALLDHLKFALERAAKGIVITNRVYWEIKTYYTHEFEIGQLAVRLVNRAFKTEFSEQEAANIAAHIINAENGTDERKDALKAGQLIGRIINIIKYQAGGVVNEHDLNYQRCVVHVKFLVERAIAGELLKDTDPAMVAIVRSQNPRAFAIAGKVAAYLNMKFQTPLPDEEVMLMAMQIQRVLP